FFATRRVPLRQAGRPRSPPLPGCAALRVPPVSHPARALPSKQLLPHRSVINPQLSQTRQESTVNLIRVRSRGVSVVSIPGVKGRGEANPPLRPQNPELATEARRRREGFLCVSVPLWLTKE